MYMHAYTYMYVYMYIHTNIYHIYMQINKDIHIYVYIYMYTHIDTCVYGHEHSWRLDRSWTRCQLPITATILTSKLRILKLQGSVRATQLPSTQGARYPLLQEYT